MSGAAADGGEGRAAPAREPWKDLRAELEARGFRPARRLGQNFLLDENMVRAIVRDADIVPGEAVLEIGVGLGFLTRHLLAAGARVVGVEIDERLFDLAAELLGSQPELTLVRADVLASKHALAPEVLAELPASQPWQVVANLPYSVSGPVLCTLSDLPNPPRALTVLVQKEVATRIAAAAGDSERGPLSIHLQLDHDARLVRDVGAALFWPRPRVESTVVRLERRPPGRALVEPAARGSVLTLVNALFQHRRQTVARVLANYVGSRPIADAALAACGIPPKSRVEELDLVRLVALAAALPSPPKA